MAPSGSDCTDGGHRISLRTMKVSTESQVTSESKRLGLVAALGKCIGVGLSAFKDAARAPLR